MALLRGRLFDIAERERRFKICTKNFRMIHYAWKSLYKMDFMILRGDKGERGKESWNNIHKLNDGSFMANQIEIKNKEQNYI